MTPQKATPVEVLTGILPATARSGEISAADFVRLVETTGRPVKILARPQDYSGRGPGLFFFPDDDAAALREVLLEFPQTLMLNHAMVHQRWSAFRWNRGLPLAAAFAEQPALRAVPADLRFSGGIWPLEQVRTVVLIAPTPPAAVLHGTTLPRWLEQTEKLVRQEFPAAQVRLSMHPKFLPRLREQGLQLELADDLMKTADVALTMQSVAVVDKFLVAGIPVLVDAVHHPLAACTGLPDWHGYKLIETLPDAQRALCQVAAHEVPATAAGLAQLMAQLLQD